MDEARERETDKDMTQRETERQRHTTERERQPILQCWSANHGGTRTLKCHALSVTVILLVFVMHSCHTLYLKKCSLHFLHSRHGTIHRTDRHILIGYGVANQKQKRYCIIMISLFLEYKQRNSETSDELWCIIDMMRIWQSRTLVHLICSVGCRLDIFHLKSSCYHYFLPVMSLYSAADVHMNIWPKYLPKHSASLGICPVLLRIETKTENSISELLFLAYILYEKGGEMSLLCHQRINSCRNVRTPVGVRHSHFHSYFTLHTSDLCCENEYTPKQQPPV